MLTHLLYFNHANQTSKSYINLQIYYNKIIFFSINSILLNFLQ